MAKKQVVSEEESRQYVPEPDKRDLFTERMNKKGYKLQHSLKGVAIVLTAHTIYTIIGNSNLTIISSF